MNIKGMLTNVSKVTGRTGLKVKKYSPEILVGVGIVGMVATTVLACKSTIKAVDIIDETKETLEKINTVHESNVENYTEEDYRKDMAITYIQTGVKLLKVYWMPITTGVVSIGCIFGSTKILRARNIAIGAAYKTLQKAFDDYRNRVINEFGKEKDEKFRYGIEEETIKVEEIGEDGKKKKVKASQEMIDVNKISEYAKFFDSSSKYWAKMPEQNLLFLKGKQNYFNDLLRTRGHVFLNEVYDALDIDHTMCGAVTGWILNENGDGFVDFGIFNGEEANRRFVNGLENCILLDFNVDGVIYDLI